jgi:hypothetical protein
MLERKRAASHPRSCHLLLLLQQLLRLRYVVDVERCGSGGD